MQGSLVVLAPLVDISSAFEQAFNELDVEDARLSFQPVFLYGNVEQWFSASQSQGFKEL